MLLLGHVIVIWNYCHSVEKVDCIFIFHFPSSYISTHKVKNVRYGSKANLWILLILGQKIKLVPYPWLILKLRSQHPLQMPIFFIYNAQHISIPFKINVQDGCKKYVSDITSYYAPSLMLSIYLVKDSNHRSLDNC